MNFAYNAYCPEGERMASTVTTFLLKHARTALSRGMDVGVPPLLTLPLFPSHL